MKKNRYLLYLLLCGLMFYIAIPELSFAGGGRGAVFAGAWLLLALLVFAGNLAAFLYTPKKRSSTKGRPSGMQKKAKKRLYVG